MPSRVIFASFDHSKEVKNLKADKKQILRRFAPQNDSYATALLLLTTRREAIPISPAIATRPHSESVGMGLAVSQLPNESS